MFKEDISKSLRNEIRELSRCKAKRKMQHSRVRIPAGMVNDLTRPDEIKIQENNNIKGVWKY